MCRMLQSFGMLLLLGISNAVPVPVSQFSIEHFKQAFILNNPDVVQINTNSLSNITSNLPVNQVTDGSNQAMSLVNATLNQVNSITSQTSPFPRKTNNTSGQFSPDINQFNSISGQGNHAISQDDYITNHSQVNHTNSYDGQKNHTTVMTNQMSGHTDSITEQVNNMMTSQEQILGNLISEFGLELCEMMYLNGEQNTVVFSPLSIATLVTLLMAGAGKYSKTFNEIDELMGYNKANEEFIHQLYHNFINMSSVQETNISFVIGNKLFLQEDGTQRIIFWGSFTKTVKENYKTSIETVDFLNNPIGATNSINKWVKSVTNGKIPQVFAGPVDPQTKFMAINTVYFKAPWQTPFETMANRISTFNTGREIMELTFMTQIMDVKLHQLSSVEASATMVEIPYTSDRYSMFIIKPRGPPGLGSVLDVEYAIDSVDKLVEEIKSKQAVSASVQIPRMRLSSKTYLREILEKMGARSMFSPKNADFSRITMNNVPILNNMIHEAVIDITEEGTEAAAVTSSLIWKGGTSLSFVLDQPSILFIYDSKTKVPIFWSRLIKPESI